MRLLKLRKIELHQSMCVCVCALHGAAKIRANALTSTCIRRENREQIVQN